MIKHLVILPIKIILLCFACHSAYANQSWQQTLAEAKSLQQQGFLPHAAAILKQAMVDSETDDKWHNIIAGQYAYVQMLQGNEDDANLLLTKLFNVAEKRQWWNIAGDHALYLGTLYLSNQHTDKASWYFNQAASFAEKTENSALQFQALRGQGKVYVQKADIDGLKTTFEQLYTLSTFAQLEPELVLQNAYLGLQYLYFTQGKLSDVFQKTYSLLSEETWPKGTLNARLSSQQFGFLGQLYALQKRHEEAISYYHKAAFEAQLDNAIDLQYEWDWYRARSHAALGQQKNALQAYEMAVNHLEAIRQDIPVNYLGGRSSFRETLEPLYLELADTQLKSAKSLPDGQERQTFLRQARSTVELLKRSELEDYFENRCSFDNDTEVGLEGIDPNTAAIYPILLSNRLEILVGLKDRIELRTVAVNRLELADNAKVFARKLRNLAPDYHHEANQFYEWLIDPIINILRDENITTLVYLPDGALRLVPLGAISSDRTPLITEFSIVTSPGLTLFETTPRSRDQVQVLLAGLSEPGPVVDQVAHKLFDVLNVGSSETMQARLKTTQSEPAISHDPIQEPQLGKLRIKQKRPAAAISQATRHISKLTIVKKRRDVDEEEHPTSVLTNGALSIVAKRQPVQTDFGLGALTIVSKRQPGSQNTTPLLGHLRLKNKTPALLAQNQTNLQQVGQLRLISKRLVDDLDGTLSARHVARLKRRLALPGVTEEMRSIAGQYQHTSLYNEEFQRQDFIDEVLRSRFDIVHIASHGVFGDSADNSFIMTHDELLTMDQLEQILVNEKFQKAPIELLTLSACQTAEGDDRAPLGISGIALRAKVRSAMGALWAVSDDATVELMTEFYKNLKTPGTTKSEALRQAQLALINEHKYQHPFFWSAFILIGNWL